MNNKYIHLSMFLIIDIYVFIIFYFSPHLFLESTHSTHCNLIFQKITLNIYRFNLSSESNNAIVSLNYVIVLLDQLLLTTPCEPNLFTILVYVEQTKFAYANLIEKICKIDYIHHLHEFF